eukprot:6055816-Prymnesium_polylepis.1
MVAYSAGRHTRARYSQPDILDEVLEQEHDKFPARSSTASRRQGRLGVMQSISTSKKRLLGGSGDSVERKENGKHSKALQKRVESP